MISLSKCKKVIIYVIGITLYGNYHSLILTFPNIYLFVKYLVEDVIFK